MLHIFYEQFLSVSSGHTCDENLFRISQTAVTSFKTITAALQTSLLTIVLPK